MVEQISSSGEVIILLVEDDPDIASLVQEALEEAGAKVVLTGSGREACDLASTTKLHLAILDLGTTDISGWDVATALCNAGTAVIIASGSDAQTIMGEIERRCLNMAHFATKPYRIEPLIRLAIELAQKAKNL